MHHEGDPAIEFVEAPGFFQGLLPGLLREIARDLTGSDAEEIEVLPIEPPVERRARQYHKPHQSTAQDQRDSRPCAQVGHQPVRHVLGLPAMRDATPRLVEIENEAGLLHDPRKRTRRGGIRDRDVRPIPLRLQPERPVFVGREQETCGTVRNIRERLDGALFQGQSSALFAPDCLGEANPLAPIIVAVPEKMLEYENTSASS